MSTILIAYGTGEGGTAKVANCVADALGDRGDEVRTVDVVENGDVTGWTTSTRSSSARSTISWQGEAARRESDDVAR